MSAAMFVGYSVQRATAKDDFVSLAKFAIERYRERSGRDPEVLIVSQYTDPAQFEVLGLPIIQNRQVFKNQVIAGMRRFADGSE